MQYLIDNAVIYDAENKTLNHVTSGEDLIDLTPGSLVVLLDFFISHPHTIYSKQEIGEIAFKDSLYSGSEANINKSLSLLRRCIKDAGGREDMISTLTSQGVFFNATVIDIKSVGTQGDKAISTRIINAKSLFALVVVIFIVLIILFFKFFHKNQLACEVINIGDEKIFNNIKEKVSELDGCKSGLIINGVQKPNDLNKKYSLVAKCEQSTDYCINIIRR